MSIVLLIDGYNVIGPVAPPGRGATTDWLQVERLRLLDRLVEHLSEPIRSRTLVVFDAKAPPRDRPSRFNQQGIEVWFAVDYPEADDLLEEIIVQHPVPKNLTVVSSDHRIQTAARRRRAGCFDADQWMDQLLDGHAQLVKYPKTKTPKTVPPQPSLPQANMSLGEISVDISDKAIDTMIDQLDFDSLFRKNQP
jgi:predicted RNA-binding protein with PIN domain